MDTVAAFLLVDDPSAGPSVVRLRPGERCTIGRGLGNRIVLHDARSSRCHAEVFPLGKGWGVRDAGSRNGTLLGDARLDAERGLVSGDTIRIGDSRIVYGEGEPPSDPFGVGDEAAETSIQPAELERWKGLVTLRRDKTRLLDAIRDSAAVVPRVGLAAGRLCRLAFALARSGDPREVARLTLGVALQGTEGERGMVLLAPAGPGAPAATVATLSVAAALPTLEDDTPRPPSGALATVLSTNEAIFVDSPPGGDDAGGPAIFAPVKVADRTVGVLYAALRGGAAASPEDLEFVMAACDALGLALDNLATRERLSVRLASTSDENERLRQQLREESRMVGSSPALALIASQIGRVAATKATVLVRGESGSGKELVARAIHDSSDRRDAPFVCLNCAALSETLLESELFGHEKGAFTGATERKAGKFEAAHRGTLFLDEIGEMSPSIQAKFLRVLEGHPFERVGGSQRVQVDVRVVAATNRHLEDAVTGGDFRRDLYFRLKVVEIVVPPLRRRPEDIEPLARHFLARFAAETGRPVRDFSAEALDAMLSYHWPGNIRELRNCVERAVVLSTAETIDVHELALSHLSSPGDTGRISSPKLAAFVPQTIDEVEHRHVMATLAAVGGNKTKAATILGIERSTLDRKLARWAKKR